MHYLGKWLLALVTPWGRLSTVPFAAMALLLISAHCALQMHITELGDDLPPYNAFSMGLIAPMWVCFCITSRRFHDSGKTAFWLVPLLIVTFASYLAVFDSLHLADSAFEEDRDALRWAERARFGLQLMALVALVVALVGPSDESDNIFGHPFDERAHGKPQSRSSHTAGSAPQQPNARKILSANADTTTRAAEPVNTQDTPRRTAGAIPTGPRGRITPAEPARSRAAGFGRR